MSTSTADSVAVKQHTFLGHPLGLYVLFFTEMWERFSYYGMRALLILYMVNYFKWSQKDASLVYKWYTSLVYLTPLLGGYLADRYLGNKRAVIIGAVLMAIGHFLMAFEALEIFYAALIFLIFGNGFFKPNMSTQVGRLYPVNDARRDGAYTIFYMGINLGAFLSPLVCGWLAENTMGGYHSGFTVAGIGMVLGLLIYLFGLRWVLELKHGDAESIPAEAKSTETAPREAPTEDITVAPSSLRPVAGPVGTDLDTPALSPAPVALSEAEAERTPSVVPFLNRSAPLLMAVVGGTLAVGAPLFALVNLLAWNTVVALEIAAVCALISSWITSRVHQAIRDRVLAIYVLGVFVVFFWAAFEQAGNAMNLWADKISDRYLTTPMQEPPLYEKVVESDDAKTEVAPVATGMARWTTMFKPIPKTHKEEGGSWGDWWSKLWNPVPTAWFQSINALAIFLLAPVFAYLWTALGRRGLNPSIPTKMAIGVLLMALAFAVMIGAAKEEDQPLSAKLAGSGLNPAIKLNAQNQLCVVEHGVVEPFHAGRLVYRTDSQTIEVRGVLPDIERDRILRETAPAPFVAKVKELQEKTQQAKAEILAEQVQLDAVPPGFDMNYAGFPKRKVRFDEATRTLTSTVQLGDKDVKALLVAGGDPQLRDTLNDLMVQSSRFRVSSAWLFWFYILSTLGELCLSPVGLSMVSKLSPAKFATMLMGLWLLTSFFGGFAAGAFGEVWGSVAPTQYFIIFLAALGVASLVLFLLVRRVVAMMHGVN